MNTLSLFQPFLPFIYQFSLPPLFLPFILNYTPFYYYPFLVFPLHNSFCPVPFPSPSCLISGILYILLYKKKNTLPTIMLRGKAILHKSDNQKYFGVV